MLSVSYHGSQPTLRQQEMSWYQLLFQFEVIAEATIADGDWAWLREFTRGNGDVDRSLADLSRAGALTAPLIWYRANPAPQMPGPALQLPPVTVSPKVSSTQLDPLVRRSAGRECSPGEDEPGPAVDKFAYGVKVPGVGSSLGDHMHDDRVQIVQPEVAEEIWPPGWCRVQRGSGDDGVRAFDLPLVIAEDSLGRHLRADLPRAGLVIVILCCLPGDDPAEPEFLDVVGQMLDQAQARPPRRKHRAPQFLLGKAIHDPQDVLALSVQGRQKRCALAASRK